MNTYTLGRLPYRALKILAGHPGICRSLDAIRNAGHRWFWSESDGVAYPNSVYEVMLPLNASFDTVLLVPTAGTPLRNTGPLWAASHLLALGFSRREAGELTGRWRDRLGHDRWLVLADEPPPSSLRFRYSLLICHGRFAGCVAPRTVEGDRLVLHLLHPHPHNP